MRKNLILVAVSLLVCSVIALLVVLSQNSIMSLTDAELQTEKFKNEISVDIDDELRERISGLIDDLSRYDEYDIETSGIKLSVAMQASLDLRKMGREVIAPLIDAAAEYPDKWVRLNSLGTIYALAEKDKGRGILDYFPIVVRGMYDRDKNVRQVAVAHIGHMARRFYKREPQKYKRVIPYVMKALEDRQEVVCSMAAAILYDTGQRHLIPKELLNTVSPTENSESAGNIISGV